MPSKGAWSGYKKRNKSKVSAITGSRCWYCGILLVDVEDLENGNYKNIYPELYKQLGERTKKQIYKSYRLEFDHILARKLGGKNKDNLVPACSPCNSHKQEFSIEFLRLWAIGGCKDCAGNPTGPKLSRYGIKRLWIKTKDSIIFYGEGLEITKRIFNRSLE